MERLIKDANKLRVAQGKTGDLTISKYSDVIEAIHTVQENMGITGTTAAEAADTIQGSLNSTKAAWKNLLVSFATGKDINKRLDSLVDSAKNVVKNVVPVVTTSLKSIGSFVSGIAPIIAQELPGLITEVGPALLQAVGSLISSVVTNAPAIFSSLWTVFNDTIGNITGWLEEKFPNLGTVFENLQTIINNVTTAISTAWDNISSTVGSIAEKINLTGILESITGAIADITGALAGNEEVIEKYGNVIGPLAAVVNGVVGAFLALKAAMAISSTIETTIASVGKFFSLLSAHPVGIVIAAIAGLAAAFVTAYQKIEWFRNLVDTAWDGIKNAASTAWEGIKTAWEKAGDFFDGVFKAIQDNPVLNGIADVIMAKFQIAYAAIDLLWSTFSAIFTGQWDVVKEKANAMLDAIKQPFVSAWEGIEEVWNTVSDKFTAIFNGIKNNEALSGIISAITAPFNAAFAVIDLLWSGFSAIFTGQWDAVTEKASGMLETLTKPFTDAWDSIKAVWDGVSTYFSETWEGIKSADTFTELLGALTKPFADAQKAIESAFNAVTKGIGDAIAKANDFLGLDLTAPFAGVAGAAEAAFNAVIGWIDSAIAKIQVFLGLQNQASQTDSYDTSVVGDTGPQRAKNDSGGGEVGSGGGRKKVRDAISMNGGTIYKNMTPFGVDQFGAVHYAGGEGAEVVVGANSLTDMIHGAMQDALVGVLSRMDGLLAGQGMGDVKVVLDTGATVGGLVREMDKQMGGFTRWRGGGRA